MRIDAKKLCFISTTIPHCWAVAPRTTVHSRKTALQQSQPSTTPSVLQRRALTNVDTKYDTCGFANGKSGLPVICSNSRFCGMADIDMDYNYFGCCDHASTIGIYSPYGCEYFTKCQSYSPTMAISSSYITDGTTYRNRMCTDSKYPYCLTFLYPAQSRVQYICSDSATTSSVVMKTQYHFPEDSPSDQSISSSNSMTAKSTSAVSDVTTLDATDTSLMSTSSTVTMPAAHSVTPAPQSQGMIKKEIIGAVAGGVGAAILAIAAFLFWRRQRKQKSINDTQTKASTNVLGSEVLSNSHHLGTVEDRPLSPPLPGVAEVDASHIGIIRKVDEKNNSGYQPYRPTSAASPSLSRTFYQRSELSSDPSLSQLSPYQPYRGASSDLRSISEVHGNSINFNRSPTPTLPDPPPRRDAGPVELEGSVSMSTQSGPIPEWR